MRDLYPVNLRIQVVALSEDYFVPFISTWIKKSYQRVVEDGMHIRNHDFDEMAELVCFSELPSGHAIFFDISFLILEFR